MYVALGISIAILACLYSYVWIIFWALILSRGADL
jgi:hypothetical protein